MLRSIVVASLLLVGILSSSEQNLLAQDILKEQVKPSMERGVEFLMRTQTKEGTWSFDGNSSPTNVKVVGMTALCGLALLESGVSARDEHVQTAARVIRAKANDPAFNYTYSVCLSVMFLNRYDRDQSSSSRSEGSKLLLTLVEKILAGQTADGRWGFRLEVNATPDNSNTQFAVRALWTARRYATMEMSRRIEGAIAKCEKLLRASQDAQGGWAYQYLEKGKPIGSMTCASVVCIALHAHMERILQSTKSTSDAVNANDKDTQISRAREFLLSRLQANCHEKGGDSHVTYFLWSLQEVATVLRWRRIDGKDWYEMGARFLVSKQNKNGGWTLDFWLGENVDTAFAVMFLARANLFVGLQEWGRDFGPFTSVPQPPKNTVDHVLLAKQALSKLLAAPQDKQSELILELQNGRGSPYTDALAEAIVKLPKEESKEMARNALVKRLEKLRPNVLLDFMMEPDRELRLAAVIAVRSKSDTKQAEQHVIPLLADSDPEVSAAAKETLKVLKKKSE